MDSLDYINNLVDNEIKIVREKLNKLLEEAVDYSKIYSVSIELDELILKYSNNK